MYWDIATQNSSPILGNDSLEAVFKMKSQSLAIRQYMAMHAEF